MKYTIATLVLCMSFLTLVGIVMAGNNTDTKPKNAVAESPLDILLQERKDSIKSRSSRVRVIDADEYILRLQSEIIDLRVQRDQLEMKLTEAESDLETVVVVGASSKCNAIDCVPKHDVEMEKLVIQSTHSLHIYLYGRRIYTMADSIEVIQLSEEMMQAAIENLELLGFDTRDLKMTGDVSKILSQQIEMTERSRHDKIAQ